MQIIISRTNCPINKSGYAICIQWLLWIYDAPDIYMLIICGYSVIGNRIEEKAVVLF